MRTPYAADGLPNAELTAQFLAWDSMRNAIVRLPDQRSASQQRAVLRTAIRQLERADVYIAAVASMEIGDWAAQRAVRQLRHDIETLRRHLSDLRARTPV